MNNIEQIVREVVEGMEPWKLGNNRYEYHQEFLRRCLAKLVEGVEPANARRDLVKAGALILAEIERIDRAAIANARSSDSDTDSKGAEE